MTPTERNASLADEERKRLGRYLIRLHDILHGIRDNIDDNADGRVYFGSTNDADRFVEIVCELESFSWAKKPADLPIEPALRPKPAPDGVTDEMVEIARLELIPMADECFMDDYRDECLAIIRTALAAAIKAGAA